MAQATLRWVIAIILVSLSLEQTHDPLNDFCRRFGHQTAVVDRRLYIDGGLVNWNSISQNSLNYSNTYLLYNDLSLTTDDGMPQLYSNLSKNSTVPDVSGGILWADEVNKIFYQYGGEFQGSPEDFSLWAYDIILDQWNQTSTSSAQQSNIQRVAWGSGVAVNEIAMGYYLGGWLSNSTVPGWGGDAMMTSTFVQYDMIANDWTNNTGPDSTGRAEGAMVFLPASDRGLLIYFGGIMDQFGNGTVMGSNMSTIFIYDLASNKWYTQTATGDIPGERRRFCAGATWPDDQSSYNIYLYGGAGVQENDTAGYDDVYILTLPSFAWIKWWPTEPGVGNPHNGMTCNVIDRSQMLIIGGTFPINESYCDSPNVRGTHNLNLAEDGPNKAMWDTFQPNITEYSVPPEIVAKVGGGARGGATDHGPKSWDNRDLPVYFSRQAKFPDRTATRAIPTSTSPPRSGSGGGSNHTGAIVGGAVGGGVGLILILGLLVCCCLRRRRPKEPKETPRQNSIHELPGQRYSIAEADTNPTKPSPGSVFTDPMYGAGASTGMPSISPTQSSQHQLLPPGEYSNHAPPTNQHPVFLAPLPEHQISPASPQFYQPQPQSSYSPQQQHHYSPASQHSPHTPNFVLPDPNLSHPYPQPGPQPYDPNQHLLHQQHFPPPQGSHTETLSTFPRSAWSQSTRTYGSTDPSSAHSPISPGGYSEPSYPPSQTQTPAQFYPQPRQVSAQEGEGGVRRLGSGASASSARWKGRLSPSGGKFIEGD